MGHSQSDPISKQCEDLDNRNRGSVRIVRIIVNLYCNHRIKPIQSFQKEVITELFHYLSALRPLISYHCAITRNQRRRDGKQISIIADNHIYIAVDACVCAGEIGYP